MRIRALSLSLLVFCFFLAIAPAFAGDVYDNGPINGDAYAWTINFGYAVSDSFTFNSQTSFNGFSFGAWLFPGDTLTSAEVSITSAELGGTTYFDATVNFTPSGCFTNTYGYDICTETGDFHSSVNLAPGTYWINLQNASVPSGDPVYWDENSGPSSASESALGTIPSESFTLLNRGDTVTGTTPEPSSLLLLGSALLGLANLARRKML